jgi:hypothetical protein
MRTRILSLNVMLGVDLGQLFHGFCFIKIKPLFVSLFAYVVKFCHSFFNIFLIYIHKGLNIDDNEVIIKNIRRNSQIDSVQCQATNGYGATAIRSFKINIKRKFFFILFIMALNWIT